MERTIDIINANKSGNAHIWEKDAREHIEKWPWMKYSVQIALKVRSRMKDLNLTQVALADKIGCTQQYISLLLKGKENMTLETISRLESALDIQLFTVPASVHGYTFEDSKPQYLSDKDSSPYGSH